jgi:hypothetical protein
MANVYFGDTFGVADDNWNTSIQFTVSGVGVTPTAGAIYSNNGIQFTVTSASITSGSGTINAGGSGTAAASGTLTKVSGTGSSSITFSSKADVNWFLTPGGTEGGDCCSVGYDVPGTPLRRLPTTADTVIIQNIINIPSYITPWPSNVTVTNAPNVYFTYAGIINAGTFNGTMSIAGYESGVGGTIVCNGTVNFDNNSFSILGGTFNGPVNGLYGLRVNGGTFAGAVSVGVSFNPQFIINGNPIFNGTIVSSAATSTRMAGSLVIESGTPVFNCAIPNNFASYTLRQGVYTQPFVLGLTAPTSGFGCDITIASGFSTSQNVTMNCKRTGQGSIGIYGGVFTGLLTINKLSTVSVSISGGSYSPPAVTTPAIKSGSNMTFSFAAIPRDPGFAAGGGTFNPTVLLSGTTNDIMGSGL